MKKFIKRLSFARRGVAAAYHGQPNLRTQAAAAVVAVVLGLFFGLSPLEWCSLVLSGGLVLALELINTSIEKAVDLVTTDFHPLAGEAKDIAAGAVLLSSLVAVIVGALVFGPHVVAWWRS